MFWSNTMDEIRKLSLVVPVYNEEDNVAPLVAEIKGVMQAQELPWELWLVDDGSKDASLGRIRHEAEQCPQVGYLCFAENCGQSAAFAAGFAAATGDVIITMDADLQNDPADIPAMLERFRQGFDMVIGWRASRQDTGARRFASRVGNAVRNALTAETVHDTGCSLKLMRTDIARRLPMFKGMHRFLPTLMKMYGARVAEMKVNHRPRHAGFSKYGTFSRGWAAFQDLLAVNWMLRRHRPGQIREHKDPQ